MKEEIYNEIREALGLHHDVQLYLGQLMVDEKYQDIEILCVIDDGKAKRVISLKR